MKYIFLLVSIFSFYISSDLSHAQTARQSASCLNFYQITLKQFGKGFSFKERRDIKRSSDKAAKYLTKKSPNSYRKLINSTSLEVSSQLKKARKKSLKAIEKFFYKKNTECRRYKF